MNRGKQLLKNKIDEHYDSPIEDGQGILENIKKAAKHPIVKKIAQSALNLAIENGTPTVSTVARTIKNVSGLGLKKGSQEAKDYMAKLRKMRGKGLSDQKSSLSNNDLMNNEVGNGFRHKKDCNDCQPIITGSSKPIVMKKGKNICGGSFREI